MIDWIVSHTPQWNSWLALLLYWLPLALCIYGYTVRGVGKYRAELAQRAKAEAEARNIYYPTLTIGHLIGHALLCVTPIANLFAAIFDVAPQVFGDFFSWVGRVFDKPLVPKREKPASTQADGS